MRDENAQQIWARVTAKGSLTAETALLPERLDAIITQEKCSAASCRQLSARLSGAAGAALRRVAAQTEQRIRQLNTVYFLVSGRRCCVKSPQVSYHKLLCDALREECLLMYMLQGLYKTAAAETAIYTEQLDCLSAGLQKNLQTVTEILQRCL